ncbi:hypothetical protein PQX77_021707 [Marasmius sp. AFHP31]|nr:hypothetical protein PQX77_021707 [Marasmius sp. AFHP31]
MKFNLSSIILTFALLATHCLAEETVTEASDAASESQASFAGEAQAKAAGDIVSVSPYGDVAAAQAPNNQPSWVFYQDPNNGDLVGMRVSGPFSDGQRTATQVIVPSSAIFPGSPIAAARQDAAFQDPGKIQVFFFDRNNILSEARLNKDRKWIHGAECPACIDQKVQYEAVWGSKFLYAIASTGERRRAGMRVGFQSVNYRNTITEADRQKGVWSLAPLRDSA